VVVVVVYVAAAVPLSPLPNPTTHTRTPSPAPPPITHHAVKAPATTSCSLSDITLLCVTHLAVDVQLLVTWKLLQLLPQ